MTYSIDGELWHAFIDGEDLGSPFATIIRGPVGENVTYDSGAGGPIYEPDHVRGEWPAAAPLWHTNEIEPFEYEALPGLVYDNSGVQFRRPFEVNVFSQPLLDWLRSFELSPKNDRRPTIDIMKGGVPHIAWAGACSSGGTELIHRKAKTEAPSGFGGEWEASENVGVELACEPEISLGKNETPYIVYTNPAAGTVEVAVKPAGLKKWEGEELDLGAEPSIDYNMLTQFQNIAYVDPASGELRVAEGFWY